MQKVHRLPQVEAITGAKKQTLYGWIAAGKFPKPIKIGQRAVAWLEEDLQAWRDARIAATRSAEGGRP
jgi:prophage regulatory protein